MYIINDISVDSLESSIKEISITESNYSDNDLPDIYNRAVVSDWDIEKDDKKTR